MTPSSSATGAIYSGLSPHAAPFTLPSRSGCAPPSRRQEGDVSRSTDDSFLVCAEDTGSGDTHSMPPISCAAMKSSLTVYPPSTHGMHAGQPVSWSEMCVDAYPSSTCATSVTFSAPTMRMTSNYEQQSSLTSRNGSKRSTVRIERPPDKRSETDKNSCGSGSKLVITENPISCEDTRKGTNLSKHLQASNPVGVSDSSQDTRTCSQDASHVFNLNPLHIPTTSADDVKSDLSDCSEDSPCWRGASTSQLSSFNVLPIPAPLSNNQDLEASGIGQKQSSSTARHDEAPANLQNLATGKNKHNHSQSYIESDMSRELRDIRPNQTIDSHGKELEHTNQCSAKCTAEQTHCFELRDNCVKRSGLNSSAQDFVPSSVGKSKMSKGPCSSTGSKISEILKEIENLTVVLRHTYSNDQLELGQHDYNVLESVIENLQSCLHKTRKGPTMGAADKAGSQAPHSQATDLKSNAVKYNGSYTGDGGKGIVVNNFASSSHMRNGFARNSLTQPQLSGNNFPKISSEEEVLVYKNLWIEAERANCDLKYQLKHTRVKIELESGVAHIGGPRNNSLQVSDLCTYPRNFYGAALAQPPMLSFPKGHPTGETSGGNGAVICSSSTKDYAALPKNLQGYHALSVSEETTMRAHIHSGLQRSQNRDHNEFNGSTLDGASAHPYIAGVDGILRGNSEYDSSDWGHVLMKEIGRS